MIRPSAWNFARRCAGFLFFAAVAIAGATPSSVTLQTSTNPVAFGQSVTLAATVSPSTASGTITFYDGVAVLGSATVSGGKASVSTILLGIGNRSLKAFYGGDATFQASSSAVVSIRVASTGQSGFQTAVNYGGVTLPRAAAIGDFNGDGHPDIAVSDSDSNKVSILLGNSDGTFQPAATYSTNQNPIPSPAAIVVGDFNGDGRADLAVIQGANAVSSIAVLLGNGNGSFQTAVNYSVAMNPHSIAAADFNGDGLADLVADNFQNNTVSILLGNGNGTFRTPATYSTGTGPIGLAVGDFNGDGKADVAVANLSSNNVSVLLGNGDGSLQSPVNYATGKSPASIVIADFDGDGRPDIAVSNPGDGNVGILTGKGDGTFKTSVSYTAAASVQGITAGDFNGDGKIDLAVADSGSNSVNILLGNGDGSLQAPQKFAAGTQPIFAAAGDFNGDGRSDLAVVNFVGNNVSILLGIPSAGPHVAIGGVVGAGLSTPLVRSLSRNQIASVFGDGFAPAGTTRSVGTGDLIGGRLPTALNGVCVYVNNIAAPLFFLGPSQINFQVPQIPGSGNAGVQVATSCATPNEVRSVSEPVAAAAVAPEFFYFKQNTDGKNPIAAFNAVTGIYVGATGLIPGATFAPASSGDVLTMFFTGGGATNPSFDPGELPAAIGNVTVGFTVSIAGISLAPGNIFYAGVAPGFAGLYQLNISVPAGTPAGNQPVILTIGGAPSPPGYLQIGSGN